MRTLVTRILWLAAAGALLYGGFVAYERWWDGDLSLVKERVLSFVNEGAEEAKDRAVEAGGEVLQTAKEEATEAAKSAITSMIGGAIESIGETIAKYGESVAGGAPAATPAPAVSSPSFSVPPPPVSLSAQVGETLTFAVNEGTRYTAMWGDGATDENGKDADATVLLRHAWGAPGDYMMALTTGVNGTTHTETFPVRIYE
jgi:hypothetical protein